jgi:hypothetical protein
MVITFGANRAGANRANSVGYIAVSRPFRLHAAPM